MYQIVKTHSNKKSNLKVFLGIYYPLKGTGKKQD